MVWDDLMYIMMSYADPFPVEGFLYDVYESGFFSLDRFLVFAT